MEICKMSDFLNGMQEWIETLSEEEYAKFFGGIGIQTLLVLFKHFPDNEMIKELLRDKI